MKDDLTAASRRIGLSDIQAEELWKAYKQKQKERRRVYILQTLVYLGALIVLLPMGWIYFLSTKNGQSLLTSLSYTFLFFLTGSYLWHRKKLYTTGGVLATLSVLMIPLVVFSLQNTLHFNPASTFELNRGIYYWIKSGYVQSEIMTLLFSFLVLYFIRFPLLAAVVYASIWILCIDAISFFTSTQSSFLSHYSKVAIVIGFFLNLLGFSFSRRSQEGFSFWSYLFGMALSWTSLTVWDKKSEWEYFSYFILYATLLLFSGFFQRKIFAFFGTLGVVFYIGHLAYIYSHSIVSAYILASVGFSFICLGTYLLRIVRGRKRVLPQEEFSDGAI